MTGEAWKTLYKSFMTFAYEARRHMFYLRQVDEMENRLFEICPFPRRFRGVGEKRKEDAR